jgi:molybdopterin-guanine dinucleotide biosynthesis protein A
MVEGRLGAGLASYGTRTPPELREKANTPLRGQPLAAFRKFYTDTATFGSAAGVECALKFFGPERLLFATDMPFGPEQGAAHIRSALAAVNGLPVNDAQREAILHTNCLQLLGGCKQ